MLHPVTKCKSCCTSNYIHITQILPESKHLHLFSKPVQEAVLSKGFGWHLKRDYFPETTQSKGMKFVTKVDLKSVSSLVSSSMQIENIIHNRNGSSSFHFLSYMSFWHSEYREGELARTEGMDYAHKVLGKKKSLNEKHLRQKRQKDVKPSDQLCHLGKRDREIKEEIFNSLLRLP